MTGHYEMRHEGDYIAKLAERGDICREAVFYKGEHIHYAEFPAALLRDARRGDYLDAMVRTIARKHKAGKL